MIKVITDRFADSFEKQVNEHLASGWFLCCAVYVFQMSGRGLVYVTSLTKQPSDSEKK